MSSEVETSIQTNSLLDEVERGVKTIKQFINKRLDE